ncbi:MAG: transposase [Deltaproteobacteria bacterium]|nr:transposase [Deltaproteobacteria bacterium]
MLTGFRARSSPRLRRLSSLATELGYTQAHDWCHARRYFIEAEATAPDEVGPILDDIGKLFLIERDIVASFSGQPIERALEIRRTMRERQSRPIVEAIGAKATQVKALSESPIGRAVKYLTNQWDGLIRFLGDPKIRSPAGRAAPWCSGVTTTSAPSQGDRGIGHDVQPDRARASTA